MVLMVQCDVYYHDKRDSLSLCESVKEEEEEEEEKGRVVFAVAVNEIIVEQH